MVVEDDHNDGNDNGSVTGDEADVVRGLFINF